ncbi:MAG: hypothetical protein KAH25_03040, partial [Bacteroidales bacterium]|nr:hypothetical protein [Bacteroidales bacterium]
FISSEAYYQTLFHEMAHSTGHTNRLNRFKSNDDNYHADSYGFEELVAELTACFIGSQTGSFSEKECNNSASYLKNWIGKLRDNPEWILKASTLAGKATEAILDTKPVYTESEA